MPRRTVLEGLGAAMTAAALSSGEPMVSAATRGASKKGTVLPSGQPGTGRSVIVIGAGIAGLTCAWELLKRGFRCVVLEGLDRTGGRNWTIRHGSEVQEEGAGRQICRFSGELYFNAGPARIASEHRLMLQYCKQFGVDLEVFSNFNANSFYWSSNHFQAAPVRLRRLDLDLMLGLRELLNNLMQHGRVPELDSELQAFLSDYLDRYRDYGLSNSMGTRQWVDGQTHNLQELLRTEYWKATSYQQLNRYQQPVVLQPVGGMDRIVSTFESRLKENILTNCEVHTMLASDKGVVVRYYQSATNRHVQLEADFCIAACPAPNVAKMWTNLSGPYQAALRSVVFTGAAKLAWQADARPWEDHEEIFGGISFVDHPVRQVWYPSNDYQSNQGVLVGAYPLNRQSESFANLSFAKRAELSVQAMDKLHPGLAHHLRNPISVVWQRQHLLPGAWPKWQNGFSDANYLRLIQPEKRFYLAGDQVSELPGWQEGAMLSAHRIVADLSKRALQMR
jgi:monoamine oxidase